MLFSIKFLTNIPPTTSSWAVYLFYVTFYLLIASQIAKCDRVHTIELQNDWKLVNENKSISRNNLNLPVGVYSAISEEDVLLSWNDVNLRWIARDNWTFTKEFYFNTNELENNQSVNLTLHGIDTVAEIRLNKQFLDKVDNMFIRHSYKVNEYLQKENVLEIRILSPIWVAAQRASDLNNQSLTFPPECPPISYNGECHMNMLRKMQASFAWDWGLAAPSMGIWKPVVLELYEVAIIRDVDVALSRNKTHWDLDIRVFSDVSCKEHFNATVTLYTANLLPKPFILDKLQPVHCFNPVINFTISVPVADVTLWWPNGFGEQTLYSLDFHLRSWITIDKMHLYQKVDSHKSIQIGFRTIELIEEPLNNSTGNTFFFRVNGQDMFMKGSNYIPSHILPEYLNKPNRVKHLLQSARDAHHNMIRVWGGGVYESDYFYNLADQYGILIWQDLMFACAMYPVTISYLSSVRTEIRQNILRIIHHPSIAILAANNENEVALVQNWYGTVVQNERFQMEYRQLYLNTIIDELQIVKHKSRPKPLVSSPSNGKESIKDNYISKNPQNNNYGDIHFYSIFANVFNANTYPRPRFASEYGFQSLPIMSAWIRSSGSDNISNSNLTELIKHRQHYPLGMLAITNLVKMQFSIPPPNSENFISSLIYLSQLTQAMAVKTETELYRSLRNTEHHTMGALYWQLNDVWVAPSWSAIDFYGNYKILHHWSKDFLAPISIIVLYDSKLNSLNVSVVCDYPKMALTDFTITLNTHRWFDLLPRHSKTWPVNVEPNSVHLDRIIPIQDLIKYDEALSLTNSFFEFVLKSKNNFVSHTYFFPVPLKQVTGIINPLLKFDISTDYCKKTTNEYLNYYTLTFTTKYPAIFVFLELLQDGVRNYKFSTNGFMILSSVYVVHLELEASSCLQLTEKAIKITHLNQLRF